MVEIETLAIAFTHFSSITGVIWILIFAVDGDILDKWRLVEVILRTVTMVEIDIQNSNLGIFGDVFRAVLVKVRTVFMYTVDGFHGEDCVVDVTVAPSHFGVAVVSWRST